MSRATIALARLTDEKLCAEGKRFAQIEIDQARAADLLGKAKLIERDLRELCGAEIVIRFAECVIEKTPAEVDAAREQRERRMKLKEVSDGLQRKEDFDAVMERVVGVQGLSELEQRVLAMAPPEALSAHPAVADAIDLAVTRATVVISAEVDAERAKAMTADDGKRKAQRSMGRLKSFVECRRREHASVVGAMAAAHRKQVRHLHRRLLRRDAELLNARAERDEFKAQRDQYKTQRDHYNGLYTEGATELVKDKRQIEFLDARLEAEAERAQVACGVAVRAARRELLESPTYFCGQVASPRFRFPCSWLSARCAERKIIKTSVIKVLDVVVHHGSDGAHVHLLVELCGRTFGNVLVQRGGDGELYLIDSTEADSDNDEVFGDFIPRLLGSGELSETELKEIFDRVLEAARAAIQEVESKIIWH